ncbi:MAG: hypothetical protein KDK70_40580 [Myxococcales bacterium]|nr:hypothetical protein [Myxococcales bacterium]
MQHAAWALWGVLGLGPSGAEAPATPAATPASPSARAAGPARLVLGPGVTGTLHLVDEAGHVHAEVVLRPERPTRVEVPPGRYTLRDSEGHTVTSVEVEADQVRTVELPEAWQAPEASPGPSSAVDRAPAAVDRAPAVVEGSLTDPAPPPEVEVVRRRPWARWAAPLLSAVVPGGGQALNGQPGRGLAIFTGTLGLVLGTVAVWAARDPAAGATPGDPGPGRAREVVRLGALGGLGAAAGLLYVGQILDAHAQAVDRRPPTPSKSHRIALEVARYSTVGFAAGSPPAYDLYSDWSLAIMGQLVPRLSLGLSDLSIKVGRRRSMATVQAGARVAYRFFDRGRVWLSGGGGLLLQGTRADPALEPLVDDPAAPRADAERALSLVPYAHFDARLFLLDRWSLGLVPRISVPLWARRYRSGAALPRYATTFELGATLGVYF